MPDSLGMVDNIAITVTRGITSSTTTTTTTLSLLDYWLLFIFLGSFIMFLGITAWKIRGKIYEKK